MTKSRLALLISIAALLLVAMPAAAHKVNVFGYVEDGWIHGEGYFPGGAKAKGCKVELLDSSGKLLAQAETDAKGVFKIKIPQAKPPLTLVLTASMGHKGEYLLTVGDLGESATQSKEAKSEKRKKVSQNSDQKIQVVDGLDENKLKAIVEKAVQDKLAPLQAQIARMNAERAIGVADVIGGLGYILGLLGLAAYMKSRKQ